MYFFLLDPLSDTSDLDSSFTGLLFCLLRFDEDRSISFYSRGITIVFPSVSRIRIVTSPRNYRASLVLLPELPLIFLRE